MSQGKKFRKNTCFIALCVAFAIAAALMAGCGGGGGGATPMPSASTNSAGAPGGSGTTGTVEGYTYTLVASRAAASGTAEVRMPLVSASVTCANLAGTTDSSGKFSIINVPTGRQTCSVSKQGYLVSQFFAEVPAGGVVQITGGLSPEQSGTLTVTSTPASATILIDGFEIAATATNAFLNPIIIGRHAVSVKLDGYESATKSVELSKDASATVDFTLAKLTTSISVQWSGDALSAGTSRQLTAMCTYSDGATTDCSNTVLWLSSNPSAATVAEDGKLTALAPGTSIISATRAESHITFPGININVACPGGQSWKQGACSGDTLQSISVGPLAVTLQSGNMQPLTAICTWTGAGEAPCPALAWNSSAQNVATVNTSGAIVGVAPGSTVVTATAAGIVSNTVGVAVTFALAPEQNCDGVPGFCVDVVGAPLQNGAATLAVKISNPPPAGIRGGSIQLSWDASSLAFTSRALGDGVLALAENSAEPGKFQIAFTAAAPVTGNATLFFITLSSKQEITSFAAVRWDQALEATNFTDFFFNLVSQSAITFRDASVTAANPI